MKEDVGVSERRVRGRASGRRCPRFIREWKTGIKRRRFAFGMNEVFVV